MAGDPVLVEKTECITRIQLNRPENRNSINGDLMLSFFKSVESVKSDRETRCLVITGSGKAFSSSPLP